MLQQAVDDAGPVEPGRDGESPGDGGGLEATDLLHPPEVQLQVRAARCQRVQAAFSAPGQEATQVGLGVVTGGALEAGQVGGCCQPQLISERDKAIGRDRRQFGEVRHAQTLRLLPPVDEHCERAERGMNITFTSRSSSIDAPSRPRAGKTDRRPGEASGLGLGHDGRVLIVRATKKLLDRIGAPSLDEGQQSTTLMDQWYATAMFWKPQAGLFVNEPTLLPVLMPLAPAATLLARFPRQLAAVLAAHGTPGAVIDEAQRQMRDRRLAKTANRSVVEIMNEFTFLAEATAATPRRRIYWPLRYAWRPRPAALSPAST